jgi:cell division protein ZapA (FtsZ GTPase activity inhibitor)
MARVREVGAAVDAMIRERKGRAMQSDLRAAIMTAYELADELREVRQELERLKSSNATRMDQLLEKLDREIGPDEPGQPTERRKQGPK